MFACVRGRDGACVPRYDAIVMTTRRATSSHGDRRRPGRAAAQRDHGVFDPERFWGCVLPGPSTTTEPEDFEGRVERAWQHMRRTFFAPEEHATLTEALARLIGSPSPATVPPASAGGETSGEVDNLPTDSERSDEIKSS